MSESTRRERLVLLALWLLSFALASQFLVVVPILSDIGRALDIEESLQGTLVSAYGVMAALFSLVAGPVSDRIGRRQVLLLGTGIMAGALLLHPLAHSFHALLAMRALTGVASGFLSGASVAYVGDAFPYERRGWANGVIMSGFAVGQIVGIPGGTLLAEHFGFAAPFTAFGVVLLVNLILLWRFVPQPPVRLEGQLTVGLALGKFGTLFRRSDTLAATLAFALMFFGVSSFITFMPAWLEHDFGADKHQIASLYLAGGVAAVIGNPSSGWLSDRHGRRGIILLSCLGLGVLQVLTTLVMVRFEIAYLLFFLTMIAASMRASPLQSLVSQIVEPERRGTLLGLTNAAGSLGFAAGSALAGLIYTHYGFLHCTLLAAASVFATAALIWRWLPEPRGEVVLSGPVQS